MIFDNLPGLVTDRNDVFQTILDYKNKGLKIIHFNAQSLNPKNPKFAEIYDFLLNSKLDVVCVSETWWDEHITDSSVYIPGFKLFRCDRLNRVGGGVAIYVSDKLNCNLASSKSSNVTLNSCFESLSVNLCKLGVCISVLYLPPSSNFHSAEQYLSSILLTYDNNVLVGDFNNNLFNSQCYKSISDFSLRSGLHLVHNDLPSHYCTFNSSFSLLDYFLVSNNNLVHCKGQFWPFPHISKHAFICLQYSISLQTTSKIVKTRRLKCINYQSLINEAASIDFSPIYSTIDTNIQLDFLNTTILKLLDKYAPLRTFTINNSNRFPFMKSTEIMLAKELRNFAYECFRMEPPGDEKDRLKSVYTAQRNKVVKLINKKKREYGEQLLQTSTSMKTTWRHLGESGLTSTDYTCSFDPNSLNKRFVGKRNVEDITLDMPDRDYEFSFETTTVEDLWKGLISIKSNAVGHDNIPIIFIRNIFPVFGAH